MNKVLRIFMKDVRHLLPELILSLTLTFGYAATTHFTWPQYREAYNNVQDIAYWAATLMFIAWWFLMSRVVHDEPLVGDRQFWITRPYGWPRVLAAKLLFIAAFILLPFLAAQCWLLHQARLHPLAVVPGLLFSVAILLGFFVLPLFALASVTPGITKIFVIVFALVVYTGIAMYISSIAFTSPPWVPEMSHPIAWLVFAVPAAAIAVVLIQYAQRNTRLSTVILLSLVAVLTATAIVSNYRPGNTRDFPPVASGEPSPVSIQLDPDPSRSFDISTNPNVSKAMRGEGGDESTEVPLWLSGIAPGRAVTFEAKKLTISGGGKHETVDWSRNFYSSSVSRFGQNLLGREPFTGSAHTSLAIPPWLVRTFGATPATIDITYAVTELGAEPPTTAFFDGHSVDMPENGHCTRMADHNRAPESLECQYALAGPSFTQVAWKTFASCDARQGALLNREDWIGGTERGLLDFSLDPARWQLNNITVVDYVGEPAVTYHLCPNSPLVVTRYHVARRRLVTAILPSVDLRAYVLPPNRKPNFEGFMPATD